jgi:ubiquinone/menaquinone biosynthesis C-methylase UbiE
MSRVDFWRSEWERKAKAGGDLRQVAGWGDRTVQEILLAINDVSKKLELKKGDTLLDIGCDGGLFEIAYAHWLDKIYAIDYLDAMVKIAEENTCTYDNVTIRRGNILNLDFPDNSFDKILCNSVLQYLNDYGDVRQAFLEINRVLKTDGMALISLIPDLSQKEKFILGIDALDFDEARKEEIKAKNDRAFWMDKDAITNIGRESGFRYAKVSEPVIEFHRRYYFDVCLKK